MRKVAKSQVKTCRFSFGGLMAGRCYSLYLVLATPAPGTTGRGKAKRRLAYIGITASSIGQAEPRPPIARIGTHFHAGLNPDEPQNRIWRYFRHHRLDFKDYTFEVAIYAFSGRGIAHRDMLTMERRLLWLVNHGGRLELMNLKLPVVEPKMTAGAARHLEPVKNNICEDLGLSHRQLLTK
jgi:hypothetical protein